MESKMLGDRLHAIRVHRRYTQPRLARESGLKQSKLSLIESGDYVPRFLEVMCLARVLHFSLDVLADTSTPVFDLMACLRPMPEQQRAMEQRTTSSGSIP
jgi:transcriptional regulator with XRE-family HTH domain